MITFADKVTLNPQPSVARENKVTDDDMNEIKSVINNKVGDVDNLDTTSNTIVGAINELVDKFTPVVLYDDSTGTTSSITDLNGDVSNYSYLEIFYSYNGSRQSTKIIGNKASLIVHTTSNNQTYLLFKEVSFSGTSMTVNSYQQWNNVWGTSNVNASNTNGIYVIKIVGYK
jgi:hypothetical protein